YDRVVPWLKKNAGAPGYDRGLYLAAQALKGRLEPIRAFYYCDQLMDEHPESELFQDALSLQYELADLYFDGLRDKFLGARIVARDDAAIDMLFRIQQRAPGSPVAEKALLRTADWYWSDGQFDLAADAYQSYVKAYPRSPLVPQARLREAYSNLAQFRGPAFDSTAILNARQLIASLIAEYPDLAKEQDLPAKMELADRQLARKLVIRADYYRRTGQPASAVKLCKRAIEKFPNLPEADDARKLLARLEPAAQ
ncbi:outer membrane protein assembly factor BamD, partial [bacterium]